MCGAGFGGMRKRVLLVNAIKRASSQDGNGSLGWSCKKG